VVVHPLKRVPKMSNYFERLQNHLSEVEAKVARKNRLMEMFTPYIPNDNAEVKKNWETSLKDGIDWARNTLKREDRVIWYLKKYQNYLKKRMKDPDLNDEEIEFLELDGRTNLAHFISNAEVNKLHNVLKYVFPLNASVEEVLRALEDLEAHDLSKLDGRALDPDDTHKVFMEFPDGWKWYLISNEYCELEGDAMKHCGNTGGAREGDTLLSLREPIKVNGNLKLKPHLTFILNKGVLGEMKGFANTKPNARFHKYIVPLLRHKDILHLKGGGYRAEKNFALSDLPQSQVKQLMEEKPELTSIEKFSEKHPEHELLNNTLDEFVAKNLFYRPLKDRHFVNGDQLVFSYSSEARYDIIDKVLLDFQFILEEDITAEGFELSKLYANLKKLVNDPRPFPAYPKGPYQELLDKADSIISATPLGEKIAEKLGMNSFSDVIKEIQKNKKDVDDYVHYVDSELAHTFSKLVPHDTLKHWGEQVYKKMGQANFKFEWDGEDKLNISIPISEAIKHSQTRLAPIQVDLFYQLNEDKFLKEVTKNFKSFIEKTPSRERKAA